jgi:hypothetical protein
MYIKLNSGRKPLFVVLVSTVAVPMFKMAVGGVWATL